MATIGQFRLTHEGYEGTISTLSMARKVRIVPNGNKKNEKSPDFFVKTGQCDLGFAHRKMSEGQSPRSEEHTSELQSQSTISYAVFCLTKKKKKKDKKKIKKNNTY